MAEAGRAGAVDAIAAVAIDVALAGERGAAVTGLVGWVGASGVLVAGPSGVARDELATVGVGTSAGRVATLRRREAGVSFRAQERLALAVRLAASVGAA